MFSQRILLAPGELEICLTARNVGRGTDRPIGCRRVTVAGPAGAPGTAERAAGVVGDVLDGTAPTVEAADPLVPEVAEGVRGVVAAIGRPRP